MSNTPKKTGMLVLTRKTDPEESDVVITTPQGDIIRIALIQIRGKQVRLGFRAPGGFTIDRAARSGNNALTQQEIPDDIGNH